MTEGLPTLTQNKIALNLDTLERDAKEIREPFVFVIGDREITLEDPANLDFNIVVNLDDEVEYLKEAMNEADLAHFLDQKLPLWKMEKLGRMYQEHYGAGEPGKAG